VAHVDITAEIANGSDAQPKSIDAPVQSDTELHYSAGAARLSKWGYCAPVEYVSGATAVFRLADELEALRGPVALDCEWPSGTLLQDYDAQAASLSVISLAADDKAWVVDAQSLASACKRSESASALRSLKDSECCTS